MTYLSEMGLLSLGSQLKAISDQLYAMADDVYKRHGIDLQGRWFPILRLLHDQGPMTVGDIATAVGQTHSAISQLANRLVREGWLTASSDAHDRRTRRLALTARAEAVIRTAKPLWRAMKEGLEQRVRDTGLDAAMLEALARVPGRELADMISERAAAYRGGAVSIVPFQPGLRDHFYRLNADWLERYFQLEPYDIDVLSNPEGVILSTGGAIFFAQLGDEIVGTCALLQVSPGEYELTKMGVDPKAQGMGIGRRLIEATIAEFQRLGGRELFLETNSKLKTAIRLYETSGFEHQPAVKADSHYSRADTYMIWRGWPASQAA
ncbi:MAG: MarR family transcriptional regulator/GNAT family N-acetyltransferase [Devosia sp.]|uniref:bifunctional helix-turn-helix transcriptional regulator/GNAT family N-acetyltransferase n=1 Tax=Devosia sp. TaxID=1871048 RepID=UPI001AD4464E|nr:bifunctional helix-turn-helix transcriptional regulator/GNAT family N-acetyltransferase [Devosia sp.]MBN9309786.1 MarR family transcriptional regulator/GNAT family N-acetyltransferase [Devosia sp.]MBN9314337.1 MarR family transcriptional regulator/GNAT family N-acetyltransferase [Devosia sp.]